MRKLLAGGLTLSVVMIASLAQSAGNDPDADYDRLDGTGSSGKTVNVIEWEGNLEIHVSPPGSLVGLALKLDQRNKNKPVMVIGYRFDSNPKQQLVRRAVLGIPLHPGFKVYRDPSADDYDKIVISNNGLSSQMVAFTLDPPPSRLYPDGVNDQGQRIPAGTVPAAKSAPQSSQPQDHAPDVDDAGTIQPFFTGARH